MKSKKVGRYRFITREDFFDFLRANPNLWDATQCEAWYFNGCKWFDEKRREDRRKNDMKRWGKFYETQKKAL